MHKPDRSIKSYKMECDKVYDEQQSRSRYYCLHCWPVVFMITAAVNHSAIAQTEAVQKLTSELSGENEVPPTESQSTGLAEFNIIGTDSIE